MMRSIIPLRPVVIGAPLLRWIIFVVLRMLARRIQPVGLGSVLPLSFWPWSCCVVHTIIVYWAGTDLNTLIYSFQIVLIFEYQLWRRQPRIVPSMFWALRGSRRGSSRTSSTPNSSRSSRYRAAHVEKQRKGPVTWSFEKPLALTAKTERVVLTEDKTARRDPQEVQPSSLCPPRKPQKDLSLVYVLKPRPRGYRQHDLRGASPITQELLELQE